ncbi:MAG: hypothetical protein V3W34_13030 [Phycisphaerae bacterium]
MKSRDEGTKGRRGGKARRHEGTEARRGGRARRHEAEGDRGGSPKEARRHGGESSIAS